jgi:hypothetical protein
VTRCPRAETNRDTGLAEDAAKARLAKDGPNEVPAKRSDPQLRFAREFWAAASL